MVLIIFPVGEHTACVQEKSASSRLLELKKFAAISDSSDENTLVQKATKLIEENKSLSKAFAGMKQDIISYQARDLYRHGNTFGNSMLVTHIFESSTTADLQLLSQEFRKCGSCISILAYSGDKKGFVFFYSEDVPLDFTLLLEDVKKEYPVKVVVAKR